MVATQLPIEWEEALMGAIHMGIVNPISFPSPNDRKDSPLIGHEMGVGSLIWNGERAECRTLPFGKMCVEA